MNRYAFCIIAHNNPLTLSTLISQIDSPYNDIYLHIDKKTDIDKLLNRIYVKDSKFVVLKNRIDVKWGGTANYVVSCLCLKKH